MLCLAMFPGLCQRARVREGLCMCLCGKNFHHLSRQIVEHSRGRMGYYSFSKLLTQHVRLGDEAITSTQWRIMTHEA